MKSGKPPFATMSAVNCQGPIAIALTPLPLRPTAVAPMRGLPGGPVILKSLPSLVAAPKFGPSTVGLAMAGFAAVSMFVTAVTAAGASHTVCSPWTWME